MASMSQYDESLLERYISISLKVPHIMTHLTLIVYMPLTCSRKRLYSVALILFHFPCIAIVYKRNGFRRMYFVLRYRMAIEVSTRYYWYCLAIQLDLV